MGKFSGKIEILNTHNLLCLKFAVFHCSSVGNLQLLYVSVHCGGRLQEEEAMLSEMEVTGQAFEDMQEQNVRLLQQLREKDDANFKLMSEVTHRCCCQFVVQNQKTKNMLSS